MSESNPMSKDSFTRPLRDDHGKEYYDMVYEWVAENKWEEK